MKYVFRIILILAAVCALVFCFKELFRSVDDAGTPSATLAAVDSEVLNYLQDKYDSEFVLWGPEGHDLYVFRVFKDHAERECHILMPENTDDIAEYNKDLSWQVTGDTLIITGDWKESFKIDVSTETAASMETGKVYRIHEKKEPME